MHYLIWLFYFLKQWTLRGLCIGQYFQNLNKFPLLLSLILFFMRVEFRAHIVIPKYLHPGFIIFLAVIWILQEMTKVRILRYVILFMGTMLVI